MERHDWSARVLNALDTLLPNEGRHLVRHVYVVHGWGDIHYVTVHSGMSRRDAGANLEEAIHTIVGNVLFGRRHTVRILWAEPT